jgi:hypothetical protein
MSEETTVTPLEARIAEVAQYEANIALYTAILKTLPTEWPAHLTAHKGARNQHDAIALVDPSDVELLAKLWYADECEKAIKTETLEMTKAKAILGIMQK